MLASDKIKQFIGEIEGFRDTAYQPIPNDKWTIGYGFTEQLDGTPVKEGDTISKEDADFHLSRLVNRLGVKLDKSGLDKIVTQNQFDAVVSLVYNIGLGNWTNSTTSRLFYAGANITDRFTLWDKAQGHVVQGLLNRREKEKRIYDEGIYI